MKDNIIKILDEIAVDLQDEESCEKWTSEVKSRIVTLGEKQGYWVYTDSKVMMKLPNGGKNRDVDVGEWLYDLVWLEYEEDVLINTHLLLESEWDTTQKEIDDDFEKLLLGKSELKVMIFSAENRTDFLQKINRMKMKIQGFKHTQSGEKYLFSGWVYETNHFSHEYYVVNQTE
ncbi:MAG: hypothetical protein ACE5EA_09150 [Nitrospirota bacterium]